MSINPTNRRFLAVCAAIFVLSISSTGVAQICQDYSEYIHVIGALHDGNNVPGGGGTEDLMVKSGDVVCSAQGSYLRIMDVSTPESPELVDWVRLWPSGVWEEVSGLAFWGDYVLVNSGSAFTVVQVTNIVEPAVVGSLALDNSYYGGDIAVIGVHAVVARGDDGIAVVDLTVPSSPTLSYATTDAGSVYCLAQSGTHVLMSVSGPALNIYDFANPLAPSLVGSTPLIAASSDMVVEGDLALVCQSSDDRLELVDITSFATPGSIGSLLLPDESYPDHIDADGDTAVLGGMNGQMLVVDIQTPASPALTASYRMQGYGSSLAVTGDLVFVAASWPLLTVIDLGNRTNAPTTAEFGEIGEFNALDVVGDLVYIGEWDALQIVDVSVPISPYVLGEITLSGVIRDIKIVGSTAYVGDAYAGLQVVDVSVPSSPSLLGEAYIPGHVASLDVMGSYCYLACGETGVVIVDVSDPADPYVVDWFNTADEAEDVQVVGTNAFVADYEGGMLVLDVSDPRDPVSLGITGVPEEVKSIAVAGSQVFASTEVGVWSIDVSTPSVPVIVDYAPTVVGARTIIVSGTDAYVKTGSGGVAVMDVSDPTSMVVLGSTGVSEQQGYSDYGDNDIGVSGDYVFYIDRGILVVSPVQCSSSGTADDPWILVTPTALKQNYPNPFNPSTTIAFDLAEEQPVSLRVYDVQGRLVTTLAENEVTGAGSHLATWQGTDESGRAVAAGIYLYELVTPTVQQARRMTLIK